MVAAAIAKVVGVEVVVGTNSLGGTVPHSFSNVNNKRNSKESATLPPTRALATVYGIGMRVCLEALSDMARSLELYFL